MYVCSVAHDCGIIVMHPSYPNPGLYYLDDHATSRMARTHPTTHHIIIITYMAAQIPRKEPITDHIIACVHRMHACICMCS